MKTHTSIDSNRLTAAGNRQLNTSEMHYVTVTALKMINSEARDKMHLCLFQLFTTVCLTDNRCDSKTGLF